MRKLWWIINGVWLLLFSGLAIFIYFREVDAAGVVQTSELRWLSLALLGVVFIFVAIIQPIILFFLKKPKS
ncbi:Na+-transporting NADH:ubiquinone oxidoreductase, subunit NqrB [Solibacillus silvestris StLB046]|uniref:Na+-transporting NADH:ubiquinone oxidoreductase, subunit NqrB n=1 Tax=Solibacillus silvestris (strain StLB046) TaxID=1002809 RepID=F2FA92_SOLSS|nr:DUF3923 family protein [Solibacillus silvestris]BAK16227.1 Na+-transporting NADH:ubiquinone oxidoreductase, subunit NqrB [Solibacillus silvestris StLB046]